ncbi:MAG TPA: ABC transporter ATP-binding protein [Acidobacteria bacterium]|nr:ABC transporter ATP-binding protein [Acidobacteriota bacterium]
MGTPGALLEVHGLTKRFDGVRALAGVTFTLQAGELAGIIGPNGAGKTTLFNVISGFLAPDDGEIVLDGDPIAGAPPDRLRKRGMVRTFQEVRLAEDLTARDNVVLWNPAFHGETVWEALVGRARWRGAEREHIGEAEQLLADLGLGEQAGRLAGELSYGQQKLVTMACCLAARPRLLLLDEPVAGVAPRLVETIVQAVQELAASGVGVLLVEHDVDTVFRSCRHVLFMDEGRILLEGPPEAIRSDPRVVEAYLQ